MAPKRRLFDAVIKEVSLVDGGDNPDARAVLWKRRSGDGTDPDVTATESERFRKLVADLERSVGRPIDDGLRKILFDEVRQTNMAFTAFDALWNRIDALTESVHDTLFFEDDDVDIEAEIRTSIGQFSELMDAELSAILAGQITKAFSDVDVPPSLGEMRETIGQEISKCAADAAAAQKGSKDMDLSKLSKTDREAVEALQTQATESQTIRDEATASASRVTELEAELAALKKPDDPEGGDQDIYKGLPANVMALLEKKDERIGKLETKLTEVIDVGKRAEIAKQVAEIAHQPTPSDELVDHLSKMEDEDRAFWLKQMTAQGELAKLGSLLPRGSDQGNNAGGSAWAEIEAQATEIKKADPSTSIEKARRRVMEENPDLYDRYVREGSAVQ